MHTLTFTTANLTSQVMPDEEFLSDRESWRLENFASTLMVNAIIGQNRTPLGDTGAAVIVDTNAVSPGNTQGLIAYLSEMVGILPVITEHCHAPAFLEFFSTLEKNMESGVFMPMMGRIELDETLQANAEKELKKFFE